MAKNKQIVIRVTEWEYELIQENARVSGMSVSDFVRAVSKNVIVEHRDKLHFTSKK